MNIVLTGFMGTGKTTIGLILSKKSQKTFCDIDMIIEQKQKMSIADIFKKMGETVFRQIEAQEIEIVSKMDNLIVSCGGGAVLNSKNIENLKTNGIIVNLYASPEIIYERVKGNFDRPVLQSDNPSIEKIKELLFLREKAYSNCNFSIDTSALTPQETADKILKLI